MHLAQEPRSLVALCSPALPTMVPLVRQHLCTPHLFRKDVEKDVEKDVPFLLIINDVLTFHSTKKKNIEIIIAGFFIIIIYSH